MVPNNTHTHALRFDGGSTSVQFLTVTIRVGTFARSDVRPRSLSQPLSRHVSQTNQPVHSIVSQAKTKTRALAMQRSLHHTDEIVTFSDKIRFQFQIHISGVLQPRQNDSYFSLYDKSPKHQHCPFFVCEKNMGRKLKLI